MSGGAFYPKTENALAILMRSARQAFLRGAEYQRSDSPTAGQLQVKANQVADEFGAKCRAGLLEAIEILDLEPTDVEPS